MKNINKAQLMDVEIKLSVTSSSSLIYRDKGVEYVVGSCPCSKGFSSASPVFLPP